ncbi:release factor glutamine methyltransferase [Telopea speciosissima]|uniref:release factor glutamine methyltransferase n=1 Tax=Telopea speciosissima TaxID=54955 RepID=UPI001CC39156|nr:release factor glutamine methyltransferase [Telopea speciosissima]
MNSCLPRIILSTVSPYSLAFKRQKLSLSTKLSRPISFTSISTTPTSQKPQIPLFLRPPTFSVSVSDLQKWQQWAKNLAFSVGSKFVDSDNGADTNILCREVKWLLEDAVEDKSILSQLVSAENGKLVRLRADLDELYCLWKQRIEERRPFQYIVGCEHWRDLVLSVQEGVLIPRPETELIVDLVTEWVLEEGGLREGIWADLGTGSGAIAIGLARILGDGGRVIATDLSPIAVSVAAFNVKRYDLQDKVEIRHGSWFEPLEDVKGELAGVVSNPPYIPSSQIIGLQAEVGRHEPRLALDGGENGMDDLLLLCEASALMLKPGGFFAFETNGEKQSKFLLDFLTNKSVTNVQNVKVISDFSGIKRFVTGFRQ